MHLVRAYVLLVFIFIALWGPQSAFGADGAALEARWAEAVAKTQPAPEPTAFERIDGLFGDLVVGPLAAVMFFDVVYWDDRLPLGEGIGTLVVPERVDPQDPFIEEVTRFEAGKGYGYQAIRKLEGPLHPLLDRPVNREIGGFQVHLQTEETEHGPVVMARLPVQKLPDGALELPPWDPASGEDPVIERTAAALGVPLRVDRRTRMIEPTAFPVPDGWVPVEVGKRVYVPSRRATFEVVGGGSDTGWFLRADSVRWSRGTLPNPEQASLPVVVLWLVLGAIFFTLRMGFINIRAFPHALAVVSGRYDGDHEDGEISHFQALSSALSATVGLGNIAGVAIAISLGGPGAVFWLWVAGFLGMSSKFTECTLGQMYREKAQDGTVSGGPMYYLDKGLAELGIGPLGKILAVLFALMCVGGSLGGGNMFQANQSFEAVAAVAGGSDGLYIGDYPWLYGIFLTILVGFVIIGGIKRIGAAAGVVVPVMCGIYVLAGVWVLVVNAADVPGAFAQIVRQAFSPEAGFGGMIGVLATGFQRASFSNEAGVGSASIAHSAAATDEPVREGIVALLEPFIDTLVVCTITALVVVVTDTQVSGGGIRGTMDAFAEVIPWFPFVLAFAAMLFAFSTMVSWSYYGERSAVWLFGDRAVLPYRLLFLLCCFLGSVIKLDNVLTFSDLMILGMAFPNILGAVLLSGKVKAALDTYLDKLHRGAFG